MPEEQTPNHQPTPEDILTDIYYYERELECQNLKQEDVEEIRSKISKAEELYKKIMNDS